MEPKSPCPLGYPSAVVRALPKPRTGRSKSGGFAKAAAIPISNEGVCS